MPNAVTKNNKIIPRTGLTVEADENQLIALAVDAAKELLVEGKAPTSIILHYLKLGTTREKLEREMLETKKELLQAQKQALESQQRIEELYSEAIKLWQTYGGRDESEEVPINGF